MKSDVSMSTSSKKHSRSRDVQKKMKNEESKLEITCHFLFLSNTIEKKIQKKPKLMEPVYSEQSESLSDNESDFNDTSSRGIEEEASGSSYRSKEISNKSMCS